MLLYHETHNDDMFTCTSDLYMKKVSVERSQSWQNELSILELKRIESITGSFMQRYGYYPYSKNILESETTYEISRYKMGCNFYKYNCFYNIKLFFLFQISKFLLKIPVKGIRRYAWYFDKSCNWTSSPPKKFSRVS